ncbi:trypsin-like peptidase domain-containing protein [Parabacteroides chinchillae]|uniref:Do/DeqQ family serine protease n=1 Tax=Parabacteroides chinchillae TaxID=871327 RepID=A0A8G2BYL5_9BACT|nr:trypsin-like peptidase domain-containing protein [Parabacteroides chinchillae]SEG21427.1 Do/DeqQ family serine protease [Parabacteroides chinchillae]
MKKMWKNMLGVVLVAAISSGAAIGTSAYMMKSEQPVFATGVENTFKQPLRLANYNSVAAENTDFTKAAENTVHGVVHIKAVANAKEPDGGGQYVDPFEFFFGNRGFQRPQPQPRVGSGSGVVISTDGYIITNNHVIEGADELEVTLNDNRKFAAKVIGADPSTDIALLKIDAKDLSIIPFGDSEKLKVGEWVLAVGNPFNLTSTVTAGIVSAKGRGLSMGGGSKIESFIQTDAAVNPGNSGGALVNTKGELVGINTAIYSHTGNFAGYSFAVPISIASKVASDLKQFGTVQRAMLGVNILSVSDISERLSMPNLDAKSKSELEAMKSKTKVSEGVYIAGFGERSSAKEAGIEIGDVIIAVNGTKVKSANVLQEQISKYRPGDKVEIQVDRNGTVKMFTVELRNMQGGTQIIKGGDSTEVLGAAFKVLTDKQKLQLGVSYGIEVTGLTKGKLQDAGIKKGFIIMIVNNQQISTPEDLEKIVESILQGRSEDQGLFIKGFYPNGRTKYYAIDLAE